jgi:hypothetical protein
MLVRYGIIVSCKLVSATIMNHLNSFAESFIDVPIMFVLSQPDIFPPSNISIRINQERITHPTTNRNPNQFVVIFMVQNTELTLAELPA